MNNHIIIGIAPIIPPSNVYAFINAACPRKFAVADFLVLFISIWRIDVNFFWTCIPVTIDHVRRGWVVMAFIIGMIETVPDVLSQLMVAIPLCLLYELVLVLVSHRWDNNEQQ